MGRPAARVHRPGGQTAPLQVLGDADHRWPLVIGQLHDLQPELAPARPWQLHRRAELREQTRLVLLFEALHDGLDDDEAHPRQTLELLVAVDPPLQVHLAEPFQPAPFRDVDQVTDLDRVAREERDRLQ